MADFKATVDQVHFVHKLQGKRWLFQILRYELIFIALIMRLRLNWDCWGYWDSTETTAIPLSLWHWLLILYWDFSESLLRHYWDIAETPLRVSSKTPLRLVRLCWNYAETLLSIFVECEYSNCIITPNEDFLARKGIDLFDAIVINIESFKEDVVR